MSRIVQPWLPLCLSSALPSQWALPDPSWQKSQHSHHSTLCSLSLSYFATYHSSLSGILCIDSFISLFTFLPWHISPWCVCVGVFF
jgi:hypothetical protein